jgi:protein RecA
MSDLMSLAAEMQKMFASDEPEQKLTLLDTGYPPLNKILSGAYDGGFPEGRIAEVFGPPASGKTLLATIMMIQAQRMGGLAIFVDYEHAFNKEFAESFGLDLTYPKFVYLDPDTWEQGNQKAFTVAEFVREKKAIAPNAPIVIVVDCIAAATPKSVKYDKDGKLRKMETRNMNDTTALARATSAVLPQIADVAKQLNVTTIYLNQQRVKPGVTHGDPTYTPGGNAPEYYAVTRLQVSTAKIMKDVPGQGKVFVGREITLKTLKSKTTRPFQETKLRLTYDEDGKAHLDFTRGMIDTLSGLGKIEKSGAWLVWDGKKYYADGLAKKLEDEGRVGELVAMLHASAGATEEAPVATEEASA